MISSDANANRNAEEQKLKEFKDARAIADAAGNVTEAIKPFTDAERNALSSLPWESKNPSYLCETVATRRAGLSTPR